MRVRIEITCLADDLEAVVPIACLERTNVVPETLGLTLAEGKAILKTIQETMVRQPLAHYVASQRRCPECGAPRSVRGHHRVTLRTAFGRWYPQFRPGASQLPSPEPTPPGF